MTDPSQPPGESGSSGSSDDFGVDEAFAEHEGSNPNPRIPRPGRVPATDEFRAARGDFEKVRDQYAERLGVTAYGQVHHAIELQVLNRYPGAFSARELNDFSNMRGIPRELTKPELGARDELLRDEPPDSAVDPARYVDEDPSGTRAQLHNSAIRNAWDRHYVNLDNQLREHGLTPADPGYEPYVRSYLENARAEVDHNLGQFFSEKRRGLDWVRPDDVQPAGQDMGSDVAGGQGDNHPPEAPPDSAASTM